MQEFPQKKLLLLSQQSGKKMGTLTIAISDTGQIKPLKLLLEWGREISDHNRDQAHNRLYIVSQSILNHQVCAGQLVQDSTFLRTSSNST